MEIQEPLDGLDHQVVDPVGRSRSVMSSCGKA
jgi:hypothetical protein